MSIKQLLLAMLTLVIVASTYAWPSLTEVGEWALASILNGLQASF